MSFILINKPAGWTSHDVVAKLRAITGEKKIGHAGTLDPFATGLLIVGIGREATRRLDEFKNLEKEYEVVARFGATSDTYDRDGVITERLKTRLIDIAELELALKEFRGIVEQVPPMYCARKIGGQKLYKLARQGKEVFRPSSRVMIYNLEIISFKSAEARLRVVCSPGTYIRSLVHDIGQRLGTGAYASELVRTRIGQFDLTQVDFCL